MVPKHFVAKSWQRFFESPELSDPRLKARDSGSSEVTEKARRVAPCRFNSCVVSRSVLELTFERISDQSLVTPGRDVLKSIGDLQFLLADHKAADVLCCVLRARLENRDVDLLV
jgi:hypothetical protein